ncbi:MAG: transposase family protein, partial [Pseudoalteromonas sp.]|nr:transposase family protein [Pseudoalteromonas sp.]
MLSAVFREMCKLYGIKRLYTTAYNPKCNGGIERLHQTLQNILATIAKDDLENWDLYLQPALSAYRTSPHDSTGYPPFLLSNGRMPEMPSSSAFAIIDPSLGGTSFYNDYILNVQSVLCKAYSHTKYTLEMAQAASKKYFDEHTRPSLFQIGDIVWFKSIRHRRGAMYKLKS